MQCIRFDGGDYAAIDHAGHAATIVAAYAELADAISLNSHRYAWREGPSVTIYRSVHSGDNSRLNKTTVCFPIIRLSKSKKRQKLR